MGSVPLHAFRNRLMAFHSLPSTLSLPLTLHDGRHPHKRQMRSRGRVPGRIRVDILQLRLGLTCEPTSPARLTPLSGLGTWSGNRPPASAEAIAISESASAAAAAVTQNASGISQTAAAPQFCKCASWLQSNLITRRSASALPPSVPHSSRGRQIFIFSRW